MMGCRYHGWSYDTRGHLIKAPQFECLEGFDKTQNSLFEIRTTVTKHGLIFVNLDARDDVPELKRDVRGIDKFENANHISRQSVWIDGWEVEGRFNWKMAGKFDISCKVLGGWRGVFVHKQENMVNSEVSP